MKQIVGALVAAMAAISASACTPSFAYRNGQGFYSDQFAKEQVQAAANNGKVQNLGRFEVVKGACFNFTQDQNDHNIIFPAVEEALQEKEGNAADQITANEQWYDFALGLLIVPGFLGCSNWTVSGNALRVTAVSSSTATTATTQPPPPVASTGTTEAPK